MKHLIHLLSLVVLACSLTLATAADSKPAAAAKETKARSTPFRGKIASINKDAKTLTVGERVFHITSDTKITKAGKSATLDDAVSGEEIGGAYREGADNKLEAVSVRLGAKPEKPGKEAK